MNTDGLSVAPQATHGPPSECGFLVVGFGPAGLGVFTAATGIGAFDEVLEVGGYAVDAGRTPGAGLLGRYAIRSDGHAESFLAATGPPDSPLASLRHTGAGRLLTQLRGRPVPLALVARFQVELARAMIGRGAASHRDVVHLGWRVTSARRDPDGWLAELVPTTGPTRRRRSVRARSLVLATGAAQTDGELAKVEVAGFRPRSRRTRPTVGSDSILRHGGDAMARAALSGLRHRPNVVIVGASHSALASALVLLRIPDLPWAEQAITILHAGPIRPVYTTPAAALADGFTDFRPEDICPRTGQVLPLAGFRSESRELLRAVRGFGGGTRERRVVLRPLAGERHDRVRQLLRQADLVVLATDYRPLALTLRNGDGSAIPLGGADGPGRLVDSASRVLDVHGEPVAGVYATGLGSGYPLACRYGEPSFTGQANCLSLWQTDIGADISRAVLARATSHPVHEVA